MVRRASSWVPRNVLQLGTVAGYRDAYVEQRITYIYADISWMDGWVDEPMVESPKPSMFRKCI